MNNKSSKPRSKNLAARLEAVRKKSGLPKVTTEARAPAVPSPVQLEEILKVAWKLEPRLVQALLIQVSTGVSQARCRLSSAKAISPQP
jgi:hypothetical protein